MRISFYFCLAVSLSISSSGHASAEEATAPLKELLPRIEPTPPDKAIETFRLEDGFRIELVAAEPLVTDPIALAFDAAGRMYVCEDRDYPYPAAEGDLPIGRVRLLEDVNGDGRYEKSTIFADHVHWPSGVACWREGVFVAAPPQILYLKDTDGDGRADVRKVVFDGFGTSAAEDIMNNLKWGIDHKIYGVASYNGGEIRGADAETEPVSVRGSSFRFDPVTLKFERLAGTGDFGNCFDDWGNRFVTNAGNLLMHPVFAEPYLGRNPHLSINTLLHRCSATKREMHSISPPEPWRVVRKRFWQRWVNTTHDMRASRFSDAELAERGFVTGAAGSAIYRGDAFDAEYVGQSFTAEPAGNVVIRLKVVPAGVTFNAMPTSDEEEFLASTDNWFRPVNVSNGPDGCLYVCDMYREIIEDPSAIPEDILKLIDVANGRDHGRIYRIVPNEFRPKQRRQWHTPKSEELVAALEDTNAWTRETAQRLLYERQDMSAIKPLAELVSSSRSAQSRLHSLHLLDGLDACSDKIVLRALRNEHDAIRTHAVQIGENRINDSPEIARAIAALAKDAHPRVRIQVAFSLGCWKDRDAAVAALTEIAQRDAADYWIRTAVYSSVPGEAGALFARLDAQSRFADTEAGSNMLEELLQLVGARGEANEVALALKHSLRRKSPERYVLRLAEGLSRGGNSISQFVGLESSTTQEALDRLMQKAAKTVGNSGEPTEKRLDAIQLLAFASYNVGGSALSALLSASEPAEVQLAAVRALGNLTDERIAEDIVGSWRELTPSIRREAFAVLQARPSRAKQLLRAMQDGKIARAELDLVGQKALLAHRQAGVRELASKVFAGLSTKSRQSVIKAYRSSLEFEGDPRRGMAVFKAQCATCHALNGIGKDVGPDLAGVSNRSAEQLLLQILDPNREVKPQYQSYTAITVEGRSYTGIIAAETPQAINLRRAEGTEKLLLRSRIEELRSNGTSLMPEGLEREISPRQMADLLAALRQTND